jgi:hypothetical protein
MSSDMVENCVRSGVDASATVKTSVIAETNAVTTVCVLFKVKTSVIKDVNAVTTDAESPEVIASVSATAYLVEPKDA